MSFRVILAISGIGLIGLIAGTQAFETRITSQPLQSQRVALQSEPSSIPQPGQLLQNPTYGDVAKIFNRRCVACHSGTQPSDGLRLDTYANVMAGNKDGPVIVPSKPDKSKILKRVRGQNNPRMPKDGPPWLSDSEISLIEHWISAGAPDEK